MEATDADIWDDRPAPAGPRPVGPSAAPRVGRRPAATTGLGLASVAVLLAVGVAGVGIGSVDLAPGTLVEVVAGRLAGRPVDGPADQIVWDLRLPRVLLAAIVGGALATSGTVMQVLVRNVLADPFLLGVSSGASVGATAVLLFGAFGGLGLWAVSVGSSLGALVAVVLVLLLARGRRSSPTHLILIGVVLSALFQSITSFLIFRGDPNATQGVLFWLLGSFGRATWRELPIPFGVLVLAVGYLVLQRRALNALAMGDAVAATVGVDVARFRRTLFLVASLCAAATVAVAGVIGFVGLVVPHLVRLALGADHRRVLPFGVVAGAIFLVLADLIARTVVSPQELPLGVVSAVIGAPILLVLVGRGSRHHGGGS